MSEYGKGYAILHNIGSLLYSCVCFRCTVCLPFVINNLCLTLVAVFITTFTNM